MQIDRTGEPERHSPHGRSHHACILIAYVEQKRKELAAWLRVGPVTCLFVRIRGTLRQRCLQYVRIRGDETDVTEFIPPQHGHLFRTHVDPQYQPPAPPFIDS